MRSYAEFSSVPGSRAYSRGNTRWGATVDMPRRSTTEFSIVSGEAPRNGNGVARGGLRLRVVLMVSLCTCSPIHKPSSRWQMEYSLRLRAQNENDE